MILLNQIPNKSLYKVQEVCDICQIKPYVLRFWDSEFDQIQSISNSSGKKLYQKKDILVISVLKDLLFERKLTIEKARSELNDVNFEAMVTSQSHIENLGESTNEWESSRPGAETEDHLEREDVSSSKHKDGLINHKVLIEASTQLNAVISRISDLKIRYDWS